MEFGWRLGVEPVYLPQETVLAICVIYFAALLIGFLSSAIIARWMAATYDASQSLGRCLALMAIVGAPLAVGSVVHLYPHVFLNVLVLVPVLIWCMYLLYRGLPVVLGTGQNRGMLMASALIAYLMVALVSLLGIMVALWGSGIGPRIGTCFDALRRSRCHGIHVLLYFLGTTRNDGRRVCRCRARLADDRLGFARTVVWPAAHCAYDTRALWFRRFGPDRNRVLQRAAHVACPAVRTRARVGGVLCLAGRDRARRGLDPRRLERGQGVCGTRMAVRPCDHGCVGRLCNRVLRHDREAQSRCDLYFQLVLRRADHRRGDATHRQQPGAAGYGREVLFVVRGRSRRRRAMVVWPQCRRLPADRRLSRNALLLPAEAVRAADLELPAGDHRVLGLRLHLHLGWAPSLALPRGAGIAAVARHGDDPDTAR